MQRPCPPFRATQVSLPSPSKAKAGHKSTAAKRLRWRWRQKRSLLSAPLPCPRPEASAPLKLGPGFGALSDSEGLSVAALFRGLASRQRRLNKTKTPLLVVLSLLWGREQAKGGCAGRTCSDGSKPLPLSSSARHDQPHCLDATGTRTRGEGSLG